MNTKYEGPWRVIQLDYRQDYRKYTILKVFESRDEATSFAVWKASRTGECVWLWSPLALLEIKPLFGHQLPPILGEDGDLGHSSSGSGSGNFSSMASSMALRVSSTLACSMRNSSIIDMCSRRF